MSPNKQLQRTVIRRRGAPRARHFIMRSRRASHGSARPLNCGVRRQGSARPLSGLGEPPTLFTVSDVRREVAQSVSRARGATRVRVFSANWKLTDEPEPYIAGGLPDSEGVWESQVDGGLGSPVPYKKIEWLERSWIGSLIVATTTRRWHTKRKISWPGPRSIERSRSFCSSTSKEDFVSMGTMRRE